MLPVLAICAALFLGLIFGLGLLVAPRLPLTPAERLVCTALTGQLLLYGAGTAVYLGQVSPEFWRVLALPAALGWWFGRRELRAWVADLEARRLAANWTLVVIGSLLALALIRNYSGGDWIGDWVGHYHRALHFLRHDTRDAWTFALDPLTARPPLQNIVTAGLLANTSATFAHYQVFTLLLGSIAVLSLGLLFSSINGGSRWLPLLLLVNPMWMQNVTYSWTRLGCAAWVLAGIAFFLRGQARAGVWPWLVSAVTLVGGTLTHYSAAPYLLVLAVGYFWHHRSRRRERAFWRSTARIVAAMLLLAATWFGWAILRHGWSDTFGANTTVGYVRSMSWIEQTTAFAQNLLYTLVPPALLPVDASILTHANLAATIRDWAFTSYQTCLPFMIGTGALLALGSRLHRPICGFRLQPTTGTFAATGAIIALSVAAHAARVRWGVGHIGLQPLALAALAAAAACVAAAPRPIQILVLAGLLLDATFGVALHLFVECVAVPPSVIMWYDGAPLRALYGLSFAANATAKHALGLSFLGDQAPPAALLAMLFAGCIAFALQRCFASAQAAVASSPPTRSESLP